MENVRKLNVRKKYIFLLSVMRKKENIFTKFGKEWKTNFLNSEKKTYIVIHNSNDMRAHCEGLDKSADMMHRPNSPKKCLKSFVHKALWPDMPSFSQLTWKCITNFLPCVCVCRYACIGEYCKLFNCVDSFYIKLVSYPLYKFVYL